MNRTDTRIAPATFLAAILLAVPIAAPATATAQTTAPASPQSGPERFSDDQLKSFAEASLEVERLNQEWSPKISSAGTAEERAKARDQAMQQMAEAVEQKGLSVQEYNQIVNAAQMDPKTARTVETYRTELR